jgi:hypothetical protein
MQPLQIAFSGRSFTVAELELIRGIVRDFSNLSLTELSQTICELLEWKRPTGKLKYEECRAFPGQLRDRGDLVLSGLRATRAPGPLSPEVPAISIRLTLTLFSTPPDESGAKKKCPRLSPFPLRNLQAIVPELI